MNTRRMILLNVLIILIIIIAGFVAYYFYNQSTLYLSTDNAQIAGQQIPISAPASGKLVTWDGTQGSSFSAGQAVGKVEVAQGKDVNVPIPDDGTIVENDAVKNEAVAAGTPLAYAYNLKDLWVTANIKETEINNVKVGQTVDVYVDAFKGTSITGTVDQIGQATTSTFSLLPSSNDGANFTKVTQVIPVRIQIQGYQGIGLAPGMSVTVRIHK